MSSVLGAAAVVTGLAVEPFDSGLAWAPDLATGWALAGCGACAAWLRPRSLLGPMLALAGLMWFVGNLTGSAVPALATAGEAGAFLYRAPLVFAVLTAPACRSRGRVHGVAVVALSVLAALPAVAGSVAATGAVAAAILTAALTAPVGITGAAVLAAALAGGAAAAQAAGPGEAALTIAAAYGAGLVIAAIATVAASARMARPEELVDVLVGQADRTVAAFRDALAGAVGDRSLEVWFTGDDDAPVPGPERQRTVVGDTATLLHRPGALDDPGVRAAVVTATLLQGDNVALQRRLAEQAHALAASGRRLMTAGDEQRRRLGRRVEQGPVERLEALSGRLATLPGAAAARARASIEASEVELRALAVGLHPGSSAGADLRAALEQVARRAALPVDVFAGEEPALGEEARTALLFTCAEALANVVKHAAATRAQVRLEDHADSVVLSVSDDGHGGAQPSAGSGLSGLRARLSLLGGSLTVASREQSGTVVRAELPHQEIAS